MKKYFVVASSFIIATFVFSTVALAVAIPPSQQFPTTADQCKKGGWQNFGELFKNQGDCVSYVATDGRNQPDGPAK